MQSAAASRCCPREPARIEGQWKVVAVRTVDVPRPFSRQDFSRLEKEFDGASCTITGKKFLFKVGQETREASYKIDAQATPTAIDFDAQFFPYYRKSAAAKGIMELKEDRLKLCFDPGMTRRPTEFGPSDNDMQLFVFIIELERSDD